MWRKQAAYMYNFKNDYAEGAHPEILSKLVESNFEQEAGYGEDSYSIAAKEALRQKLGNADASIFLVSGGTQANLLVISHLLRPHEAVISVKTGHIYANETGAIEATGHRIIPITGQQGKATAAAVSEALSAYSMRPHVVKPKMLYISNSTEVGTIYSKAELRELYSLCQQHGLYLFLDGARLGHALTAGSNDLTWQDVATYTDVFYIGGTKNGALLGEAIVFRKARSAADFDYVLKQRGALLAKGRILGIQFLTLFQDDRYERLAAHANAMAAQIAQTITAAGYPFLCPPVSNQLFPILPKKLIEALSQRYAFYVWENVDAAQDAIRIITSWATDEEQVHQFCTDFEQLSQTLI